MSATLDAYRLLTSVVGALAVPLGRALAPPGSPWREGWGGIADADRAAGGVWIHAASMGEAVAARRWGEALLGAGYRAPFLVTTRTRAGLARSREAWGADAVASLAPLDVPQAVRSVLNTVLPARLDLIETELWPNLLLDAHAASVPVVVVSGTVSPRTAARLKRLGLTGPPLFGPLHVLAQSDLDAARYRALGVAAERCAVIGDVKADGPAPAPGEPAASRRLVVFASARPGEEAAVVAAARAVAAAPAPGAWRYVVAPRHADRAGSFRLALERAGFRVAVRDESSRSAAPIESWALSLGAPEAVGLIATTGELSGLFSLARLTIVGGTFAPWGGHNVLEPAACGCAVLVGPRYENVASGVGLLVRHGGGAVVPGPSAIAPAFAIWLEAGESAAAGALAAAGAARGASRRGLEQLAAWGLEP